MKNSFLIVIALLLFQSVFCQDLSTDSKKAKKLYEKAGEEIAERNFEEGIALYQKSLEKDPNFSEAYYRLYAIYELYRLKDSSFKYLRKFEEVTPLSRIKVRTATVLAEAFFENAEYSEAKKYIDHAYASGESRFLNDYTQLLKNSIYFSLENSSDTTNIFIEKLPDQVNKYYTQYFPVTTIDDQSILFTKRDGFAAGSDEDLVIAHKKNGEWQEAELVSNRINSPYNEGAATISADGRTLIYTSCDEGRTFGSCDLFISFKEGMIWSKPSNMGNLVNSMYWESQPSLSADGKTLYFSSTRPGGVGRRDLWVTNYIDNQWERPRNMGSSINTTFDETTPYIHVNDRTFFFSSNGRPGFGGYDLFISNRSDSLWSEPLNLGAGINNHEDQLSWVLSANGKTAYFSEEQKLVRSPQSFLVKVSLETDTLLKDKAAYLTGRVRDASNGRPLKAQIKLYDLQSNKQEYNTTSDQVSGRYFIALTEGKEYGVYVTSRGYLFEDFHFEPKERSGLEPDTLDIELTPIKEGESFVLENIYFEFDSYKLNPKSKSELKEVMLFLKENDISIMIEGHADAVGSDKYNLELSEDRAKSVYDYLVANGIKEDRLSFKGYGSSRPVDVRKSKSKRNRRIEFRVVDKK